MSNDKRQEAVSKLFFEKETFNLKFDHFIQQQKEPYHYSKTELIWLFYIY